MTPVSFLGPSSIDERVMESFPSLTVSQREQILVANRVFEIYSMFCSVPTSAQHFMLEVQREQHLEYLGKGLKQLGPSFCVLDANRPWLCYWIVHSMALLGESMDDELENNTIDFLSRCQDPDGGYGGGPGQMPHLATTYAAVNSLVTINSERSLSSINRDKLYNFFQRMKDGSGAFRMHDMGEIDVRACYTAISVATMLNIVDDELVRDVGNYIASCQTYEGGIAGEPGSEAHGGYTFCGLATMILINEADRLDLAALMDWAVHRQGVELGFQGRINKLVDGCYSFWQGGTCAILQSLTYFTREEPSVSSSGEVCNGGSEPDTSPHISEMIEIESGHKSDGLDYHEDIETDSSTKNARSTNRGSTNMGARSEALFDSLALQKYILLCSQVPDGGFRDKPGKSRDFYHTCYCLSGLSVSQHACSKDQESPPLPRDMLGTYSNLLEPVHPLYNVVLDRYHDAHEFFSRS